MTKPRTNQIATFFKLEYLEDPVTDFHNFLYGSVEWLDEQNKYVIIVISG